jgi:GTPase SAR1 family protein
MTQTIKIALVGLSGAGKTTTLKNLCKNVFLSGEMQRFPTREEARAWDIPESKHISTSLFVNIGTVVIRHVNNAIIYRETFRDSPNDFVVTIHDTIGFKKEHLTKEGFMLGDELYRYDALDSCSGILFVIDSAVNIYDREYSVRIIDVFYKLLKYYNRVDQRFPIPVIMANKQDLLWNTDRKELVQKSAKFKASLRDLDLTFENIPILDTSAKENWGIREAFEFLVRSIIKLRLIEERIKDRQIGNLLDNRELTGFMKELERVIRSRGEFTSLLSKRGGV